MEPEPNFAPKRHSASAAVDDLAFLPSARAAYPLPALGPLGRPRSLSNSALVPGDTFTMASFQGFPANFAPASFQYVLQPPTSFQGPPMGVPMEMSEAMWSNGGGSYPQPFGHHHPLVSPRMMPGYNRQFVYSPSQMQHPARMAAQYRPPNTEPETRVVAPAPDVKAKPKASAVAMKGWLYKQKHAVVKTFDKRWFELSGSELRYYEKETAAVPCRVIDLRGGSVRDNSGSGDSPSGKPSLRVDAPSCQFAPFYVLAADSEEELRKWRAAIEQGCTTSGASYPGQRPRLVALVNGKSGGKQGEALIKKMQKHLGPENVFDITNKNVGGPKGALAANESKTDQTRFVVCGGDGTVGWSLQDLDKLRSEGKMRSEIPFAVLPLGTGNDMARTLKCGGGYGGEQLLPILKAAALSRTTRLDRWKVIFEAADERGSKASIEKIMCNYFSIGYDAKVAHSFHVMRETHRHLFPSRLVNKAWYVGFGIKNLVGLLDVARLVKVVVDGQELKMPKSVRAIAVINIPSYSGGANLWGKAETRAPFQQPHTDDGMLEIVGTSNPIHSALIMLGARRAERLGQGRSIDVSLRQENPRVFEKGVHCQVDGEPYFLDWRGMHEDVEYKPSPMPEGGKVDVTVKITHHAVATLVENDSVGGGCCSKPRIPNDA